MNFKPETLKHKQQILDLLKFGNYSFDELKSMLKLEKNLINNYLTGLKKNNMIVMLKCDPANGNKRHKYKLNTDKTLAEVMAESQSKVTAGVKKHFEKIAENKKSVNAGIRIISSNDYPTYGNKTKTSPWSGYTSF